MTKSRHSALLAFNLMGLGFSLNMVIAGIIGIILLPSVDEAGVWPIVGIVGFGIALVHIPITLFVLGVEALLPSRVTLR